MARRITAECIKKKVSESRPGEPAACMKISSLFDTQSILRGNRLHELDIQLKSGGFMSLHGLIYCERVALSATVR
jgi:hypothetical protein